MKRMDQNTSQERGRLMTNAAAVEKLIRSVAFAIANQTPAKTCSGGPPRMQSSRTVLVKSASAQTATVSYGHQTVQMPVTVEERAFLRRESVIAKSHTLETHVKGQSAHKTAADTALATRTQESVHASKSQSGIVALRACTWIAQQTAVLRAVSATATMASVFARWATLGKGVNEVPGARHDP
jgi:hypothetical protein